MRELEIEVDELKNVEGMSALEDWERIRKEAAKGELVL